MKLRIVRLAITNFITYGAVMEQIERSRTIQSGITYLNTYGVIAEQLKIYSIRVVLLRLLSVLLRTDLKKLCCWLRQED